MQSRYTKRPRSAKVANFIDNQFRSIQNKPAKLSPVYSKTKGSKDKMSCQTSSSSLSSVCLISNYPEFLILDIQCNQLIDMKCLKLLKDTSPLSLISAESFSSCQSLPLSSVPFCPCCHCFLLGFCLLLNASIQPRLGLAI